MGRHRRPARGRDPDARHRRAARGRGVGEALVRATIARSRELALDGMAFSTRPQMTAAHRVYERTGFRRTPERDWSPYPGMDLMVYSLAF